MKVKILSIFLLLHSHQSISQKVDTLHLYQLPNQIFHNTKQKIISKELSQLSKVIIENQIDSIIPNNIKLLKVVDSTLNNRKAINKQLIRLINQLENGSITKKHKINDTLLNFISELKCTNLLVILGTGNEFIVEEKSKSEKNQSSVIGIIAGIALGTVTNVPTGALAALNGRIPYSFENQNCSIFCLVLNHNGITYFRSDSKKGSPSNHLVKMKVLKKVVLPYFK